MNIAQISYLTNVLSLTAIGICWAVFAATLIYLRGGSTAEHRGREPLSWIGLVVQLISYPISWAVWRSPFFSPFIDGQYALNIGLQIFAIVLGASSAWLAVSAIRELGKQWSLQARVLKNHKLITTGPYNLVRHPIYTAMLGMLIATGLAFSHWLALGAAVVVFLAGTKLRIHLEEKLLGDAFGEAFTSWRARVPALLPSVTRLFRNN